MKPFNIYSEARKLVTDCIERGEVRTLASYVDIIMADHKGISGEDADFYLICARHRVKEVVSTVIGKFTPKKQSVERQLILDGFEHLQVAYTFERDGQTVLVPVDQCTDIEMGNRAREYQEMAGGCLSHAREIFEYLAVRGESAA